MADENKKMPTSRVRRSAIMGRVAAGQAMRVAGTRFATAGRSDEKKQEISDRRQAEAAQALVEGLGLLRGAAMKVGQMLSMVDGGLVAEEYREDFQRSLAALQSSAPTVPWAKMKASIEAELGQPLNKVFSRFDEVPIAAASIGQVYRATLLDGREVAVKVQYPGIDKAVKADLSNLGMIMRAMKRLAPGTDVEGMTREIRERIGEELDYELEAQNQRMAARTYRDHPFVVIPAVITDLSTAHVLVTEFFEGKSFDKVIEEDQATRDRVGEIVFRFYGGSLYRQRQFSPDPHPGNFLVGADGRVAFLDFGLYRHMDEADVEGHRAILRAVCEGDPKQVHAELVTRGFINEPDRVPAETAMSYLRAIFWWMADDEDLRLEREAASDAMAETINPRSEYYEIARDQTLPPEYMFVMRMIVMVMAALGQLEAGANWHRIAREWLYGDPPSTPLGVLDAVYRGEMTGPAA